MTWARLREWIFRFTWRGRHFFMPFIAAEPFSVLNLNSNRRTKGTPMAYATEEQNFIDLKALTWSAAKT